MRWEQGHCVAQSFHVLAPILTHTGFFCLLMKRYEKFKYHYVDFDEQTGDYQIHLKVCEHEYHLVKYQMSDGRWMLREQCKKCAHFHGSAQSQHGVDMSKMPIAAEQEDTWEAFQEERNELTERLNKKRQEIRFAAMDKYYDSPEWEERRQKVFKRDNYKCQSCLDAPAEQCHHLTYEHFKNEPLFDLISVCKACHDKITLIDRENRGQ